MYMTAFGRHNEFVTNISWVIESYFALHLLLGFMTEYYEDGINVPIRDFTAISNYYIYRGNFFRELIPVLPLEFIPIVEERQRLFYLIKVIRTFEGMVLFDDARLIKWIKDQQKASLRSNIKSDSVFAIDVDKDNTKITEILYCGFVLRILNMLARFVNLSFFMGMIWYVFCL